MPIYPVFIWEVIKSLSAVAAKSYYGEVGLLQWFPSGGMKFDYITQKVLSAIVRESLTWLKSIQQIIIEVRGKNTVQLILYKS